MGRTLPKSLGEEQGGEGTKCSICKAPGLAFPDCSQTPPQHLPPSPVQCVRLDRGMQEGAPARVSQSGFQSLMHVMADEGSMAHRSEEAANSTCSLRRHSSCCLLFLNWKRPSNWLFSWFFRTQRHSLLGVTKKAYFLR